MVYVSNNIHDDVSKKKHLPRYWPFERGIHCSTGIPATKASDAGFEAFFNLRLNIWLSKQSTRMWFETPARSLWRNCNDLHKYTDELVPMPYSWLK